MMAWSRYLFKSFVLPTIYTFSTCTVIAKYGLNLIFLSGDSMLPTIQNGDIVITRPFRPRRHELNKGEIVCLSSPTEPEVLLCKRVAYLPQDIIPGTPLRVVAGHCFILGDNLEASSDSRIFGPVPIGLIHSRVVCRVWPPSRFGYVS